MMYLRGPFRLACLICLKIKKVEENDFACFFLFIFFFETNRIKCFAFYDGIMRQKFFLAICVFPFLYTSSQCTISLLTKAAFLVIDRA